MLLGWPSWWPRAATRATCHYCGERSVLECGSEDVTECHTSAEHERRSRGTLGAWTCSACGSSNHQAADGRVLDVYERAMWDAGANVPSHASGSTSSAGASVFCRTCLTHQTLVTNLLSNYLADDGVRPHHSRRTTRMTKRAWRSFLRTAPRWKSATPSCVPRARPRSKRRSNRWIAACFARRSARGCRARLRPRTPQRHRWRRRRRSLLPWRALTLAPCMSRRSSWWPCAPAARSCPRARPRC